EAGIAIAAAVKLYPAVTAGAFLFGARRELKPLAWCLGLMAALVLLPPLLVRRWSYSRTLLGMIGPDTFWSDQSLNGFLSRLGLPSQWTVPPLPGLPVTPLMLLLCAALGIVVVILLTTPRDPHPTTATSSEPREMGPGRTSWQARYALLLWFAVVAAPKN